MANEYSWWTNISITSVKTTENILLYTNTVGLLFDSLRWTLKGVGMPKRCSKFSTNWTIHAWRVLYIHVAYPSVGGATWFLCACAFLRSLENRSQRLYDIIYIYIYIYIYFLLPTRDVFYIYMWRTLLEGALPGTCAHAPSFGASRIDRSACTTLYRRLVQRKALLHWKYLKAHLAWTRAPAVRSDV